MAKSPTSSKKSAGPSTSKAPKRLRNVTAKDDGAPDELFQEFAIALTGGAFAGCCQSDFSTCGSRHASCLTGSYAPDSLYFCQSGDDPVLIRACSKGECREMEGGNDVCRSKSESVGPTERDSIKSEGSLPKGRIVWSNNNLTKLLLQEDGNLVVYRVDSYYKEVATWASGSNSLVVKPVSVSVLGNDKQCKAYEWSKATDADQEETYRCVLLSGDFNQASVVRSTKVEVCGLTDYVLVNSIDFSHRNWAADCIFIKGRNVNKPNIVRREDCSELCTANESCSAYNFFVSKKICALRLGSLTQDDALTTDKKVNPKGSLICGLRDS
ncbi:hypothetical protein BV898_18284 [Hypsibius exemplaris]|uniref:Apple domain-containing protein n=1 Tax=Hypsibius exemplaris TaxID=2072580 RepID=A0A9X6NIJ4_HYPEX|nr:hypothetical protein BV898_18284 [Hypsibius exemplaris]